MGKQAELLEDHAHRALDPAELRGPPEGPAVARVTPDEGLAVDVNLPRVGRL
jgi:hypothetical protein